MTCLEKLSRANRWRVRTGRMASDETAGWNGYFLIPIDGQIWQIQIADGMGWKHLSATNAQKHQLPSWQIMVRLKSLFFSDEEWVVMYIPAQEDYVNDHPYVHHLWAPLDEKLPIPPIVLV